MKNNLARLFGRLRKTDKDHAAEGFQITSEGEKIRIERRMMSRRKCAERRVIARDLNVDRRIKDLERRSGVDWRAWIL